MPTSNSAAPSAWIAVVSALPVEVRPLVRKHGFERVVADSQRWRGQVSGKLVEVVCTGVGLPNAGRGIARILAETPPRAFVFVGTAGAISVGLNAGDLLVPDRVLMSEQARNTGVGATAEAIPVPKSLWTDRAAALAGAQVGTLLSSRRVVSSAIQKRDLAERHALGRVAAAVDMESYEWASAARAAGIPFVVVRAVSDTAAEDLPLDFNLAVRPDGSLSKARVIGKALSRPGTLPGLLNLHDRVRLCARRLEQAVVSILD